MHVKAGGTEPEDQKFHCFVFGGRSQNTGMSSVFGFWGFWFGFGGVESETDSVEERTNA